MSVAERWRAALRCRSLFLGPGPSGLDLRVTDDGQTAWPTVTSEGRSQCPSNPFEMNEPTAVEPREITLSANNNLGSTLERKHCLPLQRRRICPALSSIFKCFVTAACEI